MKITKVLTTGIAAVAIIAVGAITAGCGGNGSKNPGAGTGTSTATNAAASPSRQQSVLPFVGLYDVVGLAVDGAGTAYVFDGLHPDGSRPPGVVTLAAGADNQTILPNPCPPLGGGPLAVDTAGNIYVACTPGGVVKIAAGSSTGAVLPFADQGPLALMAIAVDGSGAVYTVNGTTRQVLKLAPGAPSSTVLPFGDLTNPTGVAADSAGNVYVTEGSFVPHAGPVDAGAYSPRVLKLAAGSSTPTVLPFDGRTSAFNGVAVDAAGNLYVANNGRIGADGTNLGIVELAAGSRTPTVLPFTGLGGCALVAVDTAGNVYDYDSSKTQVVKLAAK